MIGFKDNPQSSTTISLPRKTEENLLLKNTEQVSSLSVDVPKAEGMSIVVNRNLKNSTLKNS